MQCVVLAGGKGTRLQNVFGDKPKLLVPVLGEPFADIQITRLVQGGFSRITYAIGFGADQIREHFSHRNISNPQIDFLSDGDVPLGTGGAIRKLYDEAMLDDVFAITYGDTLLNLSPSQLFNKLQESSNYSAVLSVWRNDNFLIPSNLDFDGQLVRSYDKVQAHQLSYRFVDYGMLVVRRDVIPEYLPSNEVSDLGALISRLASRKQLLGFEVFDRFFEIGTLEGLKDTELHLNESIHQGQER